MGRCHVLTYMAPAHILAGGPVEPEDSADPVDHQSNETCSACGPLGPCVIEKDTRWSSSRLR